MPCLWPSTWILIVLCAVLPNVAVAQIVSGPFIIQLDNRATIPGPSGAPNTIANARDGRLFVAAQNGFIHIVNGESLVGTPFLNMNAAGLNLITGGETGLLGLAFHPNYNGAPGTPGAGKLYTFTSEDDALAPAPTFNHPELSPAANTHHNVVREWTVSAADPNLVDPGSSRVLFSMNQPQSNHNGGGLAFGNDGYLYISVGDGGGGDDSSGGISNPTDGHTNSPGAGLPHGNAQDLTNVYGKILRVVPTIEDDGGSVLSANGQYRIPTSNPFDDGVGSGMVDEIFAYGLRNPFRISIDSATGDLWTGDVGQNVREEVDLVTAGGNYGWVTLEGTRVNYGYDLTGAEIDPVAEYTHADGFSVIGGFVYRGSMIPDLQGMYVFGDAFGTASRGRLFYLDPEDPTPAIHEFLISGLGDQINPGQLLFGFGVDANGELYAAFSNGLIVAMVPEPGVNSLLTGGLALGGMVGWRRRRARQAAST